MEDRRDHSPTGQKRRLEEKTIWNCTKCFPRLCTCTDRHVHGTHKDQGSVYDKRIKENQCSG
jgi:hypothetical protein